jgi:hypothetical protein
LLEQCLKKALDVIRQFHYSARSPKSDICFISGFCLIEQLSFNRSATAANHRRLHPPTAIVAVVIALAVVILALSPLLPYNPPHARRHLL